MADLDPESILQRKDREQLSCWIGKSCQFQLLYRVSRDGLSARTFHNLCDNKGPTVTVLHNSTGNVFGGYLSESWNSNNSSITDRNAFLFQLQNQNSSCAYKFNIKTPTCAAYGVQSWGPTFGGQIYNQRNSYALQMAGNPLLQARNCDLHLFSDTDNVSLAAHRREIKYQRRKQRYSNEVLFEESQKKNQQMFNLNGHENPGNSYHFHGQHSTQGDYSVEAIDYDSLSNGNFQVKDLEVYWIKEHENPSSKALASGQPWREVPLWNSQSLKEHISGYHPLDDKRVPDVNILLLGQVGAGKSSFFNTINSIFRGEITSRACTGSSEHSLTRAFRKYRIRDPASGQFLKLRLCDTRGLEEGLGVKTQDIACILDGNLPEHYQFNPTLHATPKLPGFVKNPLLKDKIHCVAFVIDASTVDVMNDAVHRYIKEIQSLIVERGIPQAIYLTKLDKICPDVDDDVKKIFTSNTCKQAVDTVADVIGVPRSHVFPVKNYEKETSLHIPINILALSALRQTLVFADDYLEDQSEIGDWSL